MIRSLLALLLALSLWPTPAAAGPGVPAPAEDRIRGVGSLHAHDAVRTPTGLDLVRGLESHGAGGSAGRSTHGPGGSPSGCHPSGGDLLAAGPLACPAPRVQDVDGAVAPLSERLPYFATAPPSQR